MEFNVYRRPALFQPVDEINILQLGARRRLVLTADRGRIKRDQFAVGVEC
jgi:hypothetical protein